MDHTWTNQVSSWRPYVRSDPNLHLYTNEFASSTVNWTKVFTSGGSPVVSVSGGVWSIDTTGTPGYHVYRADSGAAVAPWTTIEIKVTAMPVVASGCFAGPGLADSAGNFLGIYYNAITGDTEMMQIVSGVLSNLHGATYSLSLPFTISFSFCGGYVVGHIDDGTTNTLTLAYHNDTFDFSDPAVLADFNPAWFVGTHPASAGGVISLDYVHGSYFGELGVREMYPVVNKLDFSPVTDETGRILVTCTSHGVAINTTDGYCGWGTRWYDPVARTFSDFTTRIFQNRGGHIKGDSDGWIMKDGSTWHIWATTASDFPGTAFFNITYKSTTTDLRNSQVLILDDPVAMTLPAVITTPLTYDLSMMYIADDPDGMPWHAWFSENNGGAYNGVLAKGASPDNVSTLIARLSTRPNEEGAKFVVVDGVPYAAISKSDNTTQVYDLLGNHLSTNFGLPALPANSLYHPHPSIVAHQYLVGGVQKRRYHELTFTDSVVTTDGVNWGAGGWNFGAAYISTTEELDGWDFTPPAVGGATQAPGLFFALS